MKPQLQEPQRDEDSRNPAVTTATTAKKNKLNDNEVEKRVTPS